MKKSLFLALLLAFNAINCEENQQDSDVVTYSLQESKERNFLLNFDNVKELSENNALSDLLKNLLDNCLKIVRQLIGNNEALGTKEETQSAKGYLAQLLTLKERLADTSSTDKINKIQEINEYGKDEIEKNKKIVEQIKEANSIQKISELPGINKDVVERIKNYNHLISQLEQIKTIDDIASIQYVPKKIIEDIKHDSLVLSQIGDIDQIAKLKQFSIVNTNLIDEIEKLESLKMYISNNTNNIAGILKIPGLSESGIVEISRLQKDFEVMKEQNKKQQQEILDVSKKYEQATIVARNEYHFRMIVISLLLRIAFGFEFIYANDFKAQAKEYDKSVISHANSVLPYSSGIKRNVWQDASNHLGVMLQVALSVENITEYLDVLISHIDKVVQDVQEMNDLNSKFILDALTQLDDVLNRFNKNQDSMKFGDFNGRKRMILDRIEKEKRELEFAKQEKKDRASAGEKEPLKNEKEEVESKSKIFNFKKMFS